MAESSDVSPCKRAKLNEALNGKHNQETAKESNGNCASAENGTVSNALEDFEVVRVLNHLRERHCIFLLAKEKKSQEENAIIKLEKTAFKVCSSQAGPMGGNGDSHWRGSCRS